MRNTLIIALWVIALPVAEMSYEFFAVRPTTDTKKADLTTAKPSLSAPQAIRDKNGVLVGYKDLQGHIYDKGHYPVMPDNSNSPAQLNTADK
ncbi:MAG: hypothetical protein NTV43_17490 [Methylococcales bacterium]|nr:hypothetical protein [Methylococcales bacterium]